MEHLILAYVKPEEHVSRFRPQTSGRGEVAWFHRFWRRKNPRKTQTAISDPPGVGNSSRTVEPESSETLGISRKRRWLLR
jgi:hypothetical protein